MPSIHISPSSYKWHFSPKNPIPKTSWGQQEVSTTNMAKNVKGEVSASGAIKSPLSYYFVSQKFSIPMVELLHL